MGALDGHGCAHPCARHLYEDRCARPGCRRFRPAAPDPWRADPGEAAPLWSDRRFEREPRQ